MTAPQAPDAFTELVDADIPRVDLVDKAANGTRFLIAKAADGGLTQPLVPADMVRDLIAKADLDVTDAPAADDLIPEVPGGTTAASVPGSPDWEKLDGDTAMDAVAVLGRLKGVLGWLADREAQEAVTGGDAADGDNAWDLDDMACQIDYMIGRLAGFAVGEHMEADELAPVGKACAGAADSLAVVERLAPIAKAGRVLSSANESAIRTAVESLTGVLNSLPQAPAAEEPVTKETAVPETTEAPAAAEPVDLLAKMLDGAPELTAADAFTALAGGGRAVAKAAGDPQLAVFDADGKLIGTIDPGKLSPIATSPAAAEPAEETPADDAATDAPAPADPAAPAPDPADGAVIPGTDTVQAPAPAAPADDDTQTPTVAKAVADAIKEAFAPFAEQAAKSADLAKAYDDLKDRVEKMGAQPDNRRSPVLNGATGTPGAVTRDGHGDGEQFADLRKAVEQAQTDGERDTARARLAFAQTKARFER